MDHLWQVIPPTTSDIIPWQPEPTFRGTSSILIGCITTLFICVWSVLHVDIPTGRSTTGRYLSKCGWLLVALLCPELLFLIAFGQFRQAVFLTLEGQRALPVDGPKPHRSCMTRIGARVVSYFMRILASVLHVKPTDAVDFAPKAGRRHPWTMVHAYYAAMGGFVLNDPYVPRSNDHYLPSWQMNGILTPDGIRLIMKLEPSLIPDLAYDDIVDRSKADGLAKALLVWQVSWFLITCSIRYAQGLSLCLLEITTFAHAACTLLTYLLWWQKPKDVNHQTVIVGPEAALLGASLSMSSAAGQYLIGGLLQFHHSPEMSHVKRVERDDDTSDAFQSRDHKNMSTFKKALIARFFFSATTAPWYIQGSFKLEPQDEGRARILRWDLALKARRRYGWRLLRSMPSGDPSRAVVPKASLQAYTVHSYLADMLFRTLSVTALLGGVYGLPHLLGVTVTFPSATERTLWLGATAVTAAVGIELFAMIFTLLSFLFLLDCLWARPGRLLHESWGGPMLSLTFVLGAVLYFSASGFLVAESIRQLFVLPPAAFALPSWIRYWPHFS